MLKCLLFSQNLKATTQQNPFTNTTETIHSISGSQRLQTKIRLTTIMGHDSQILTNNLLWTQPKQQTYIICSIRLKFNIPCLPFNHLLSHLRTYDLLLWSNICYKFHMFRHFPQTDSTDVTYLHRIQLTQCSLSVH